MFGIHGSTLGGGRLVDHRLGRCGLFRGDEAGHPAIGQPTAAAQRRRLHTAEPDLEGVLEGPGVGGYIVQLVEAAVVGDPLLGPQPAQHAEQLVEHGGAIRSGHASRGQLGGVGQPDDREEQEAPAGEPVERRELAGQAHRVLAGEDEMGAHLQLGGAPRRVTQD